MKKARAEFFLQCLDLGAERRLRDTQPLRGAGKMPFVGNG
jgi:hypothetical protein